MDHLKPPAENCTDFLTYWPASATTTTEVTPNQHTHLDEQEDQFQASSEANNNNRMVLPAAIALSGLSPHNFDGSVQQVFAHASEMLATPEAPSPPPRPHTEQSSEDSEEEPSELQLDLAVARMNLGPYFNLLTREHLELGKYQVNSPIRLVIDGASTSTARNEEMWWNNKIEEPLLSRQFQYNHHEEVLVGGIRAALRQNSQRPPTLTQSDQLDVACWESLQNGRQNHRYPQMNADGGFLTNGRESEFLNMEFQSESSQQFQPDNWRPFPQTVQRNGTSIAALDNAVNLAKPQCSSAVHQEAAATPEPYSSLIDLVPKAALINDFAAHLRANFTQPLVTPAALGTGPEAYEQNRSVVHRLAGLHVPEHIQTVCSDCDFVSYNYVG